MSLLMDALRKAEQQKQQGTASSAVPAGGGNLSLEPLAEPRPEPVAAEKDLDRRLPELPKRLEELDDQFFTADPVLQKSIRALAETKARAAEPPPAPVSAPSGTPRAAAQNVFAVKQTAPSAGHGFAITVGIATLIASAAIGAYLYWQMQPRGGLVAGPGLAVPQQPVTPPPAPAAVQAAPPAPATPEMAAPAPPARAATALRPGIAPAPPQGAPERLAAPADSGIRFSTRQKTAGTAMEDAHQAFTRGETDLARSIWMKTFQADPRNINALHGLAAIAQLEGRPDQTTALYRRVLELDPKDAVAHAGLLAISAPTDPRHAESQLKGLLAEQPNSPPLHFALGNLYMSDSRWAEAQQAFFKAHVADPANPDYLYNLAVSLDHLHQAGLAAQYYARAQDAARSQPAAFDPAQVEERLRTLRNERQR
ncbi:MAG: tetratricopeptide repeat protein [Rhodocyclaceae bacterium]